MLTHEEFEGLAAGIRDVVGETNCLDTVGLLITMVMRLIESAPVDVRKDLCTSIVRTFTLMSLSDEDPRH